MTNDEFAAWLRVEFDSISAAEKALEIDRDTLKSMMSGVRRKSGPVCQRARREEQARRVCRRVNLARRKGYSEGGNVSPGRS